MTLQSIRPQQEQGLSSIGENFAHNQPQLRVLMVAVRYYPFMGGMETHTYEVARRLVQNGVSVTVLTTNPGGKLAAEETVEGVQILRVKCWPEYRDFSLAPDMYRIISQGGWDVVHCQGYHTLVPPLAMLAAWRAGIPYVVSFHSGGHSSRLRNMVRSTQWAVLRPLMARASRLIAVSNFEAKHFAAQLKLGAEHFVVIPNGAKMPEAASDAVAGETKMILSVGRLERYKGHHRLIEALPHILEEMPNVNLRIAGAGPYEAELRRIAAEWGVERNVEIAPVPPDDRQAMANTMAQAALVTLFSEYEAHPIAVMEALALKRPVLVADTSGLSELAERGWVTALPLHSTAEEIAAAVVRQLAQPLVPAEVELPTWENCTTALTELYHNVARRTQCVS